MLSNFEIKCFGFPSIFMFYDNTNNALALELLWKTISFAGFTFIARAYILPTRLWSD